MTPDDVVQHHLAALDAPPADAVGDGAAPRHAVMGVPGQADLPQTAPLQAVPERYEGIAREALAEIAPASSIGAVIGAVASADGVIDVLFESLLPGYLDWRWTVSMAELPDLAPTVLELELLPGHDALLAPAWVPWEARLAEYRRTHPDEPVAGLDSELDDEELDSDDLDSDDLDSDDLDDSDDVDDSDDLDDADLEVSDLDPADELDESGIDVDLLAPEQPGDVVPELEAEVDHP